MLDAIVQGAAVGLFHSFGVAVAPLPKVSRPVAHVAYHELTGAIAFDGGSTSRGTLLLSMPKEVHALVSQASSEPYRARDAVRELTNQLMGRIKNRLTQFQMNLSSGLPTLLEGDGAERRRKKTGMVTIYPFRTLRGELAVVLDGTIDEAALVYSGTAAVAREGDIIIF